jgi:hypothetical protein
MEVGVKKIACIIAVICLVLASDVNAENTYHETMIRCEKGIVSLGDAEIMLFTKCGNPIYQRQQSYKTLQLTYAIDGMFRVVTIKNGIIKSIITAGRSN